MGHISKCEVSVIRSASIQVNRLCLVLSLHKVLISGSFCMLYCYKSSKVEIGPLLALCLMGMSHGSIHILLWTLTCQWKCVDHLVCLVVM